MLSDTFGHIHMPGQGIHSLKRLFQFLRNSFRETFHHPDDGAVLLQEHKRIVIAVPGLLLLCGTYLLTVNLLIRKDPPLCQKADKCI